jgi:hypothetical protein
MLFRQCNTDTEYDRGETPVQKAMVISERDEITRFVSVVDGGGLTLEMVASSLSSTPCVHEDLTRQTFYLEFPLIAIFSPEGNLFHFTKHLARPGGGRTSLSLPRGVRLPIGVVRSGVPRIVTVRSFTGVNRYRHRRLYGRRSPDSFSRCSFEFLLRTASGCS